MFRGKRNQASAIRRRLMWAGGIGGLAAAALALLVRATTLQPAQVEPAPISGAAGRPLLQPGQRLSVLSYNVQYMAGKDYVFFYDLPNSSGPDLRPTAESITHTIAEVARIIRAENPDIVLLQELDYGARRTDYRDQLAELLRLLPVDYGCHATAFYWKAAFLPHPRIMGPVGMRLATLSKYRISSATRHQLPLMPGNWLVQQFNFKRAILETRLPIAGGGELAVLNTHLDAFAHGTDTMERQLATAAALLDRCTRQGIPWLIGGDFNLLPPGPARAALPPQHQEGYREPSELAPWFARYHAVPALPDLTGPDRARWYTFFHNDPAISAPDRTIDYLFYADTLRLARAAVRQHDTLAVSDHLPVVAEFALPGAG
jgi:endonuclease/exonuclease/phosphatase family metal-dependent hydrolase